MNSAPAAPAPLRHRRNPNPLFASVYPCYPLLHPIFSGTDLRVVLDLLSFPTVCLNIRPGDGLGESAWTQCNYRADRDFDQGNLLLTGGSDGAMPKDRRRRTSSNYRKPPTEFQYKKGESGNPKGRPKKKPVQPGLALFRTMFRAAAQGDTKAARQLLEVIARAESGRVAMAVEMLQSASDYKKEILPIFEKHEREGLEPPEIYLHPDDLIIDDSTGEVTIDGPMSKEQAGALEAVRQRALELMPRYFEVVEALKKDPSDRALRQELKELKKSYDVIKNDSERNARHEALRLSRRALQPKPAEPEDVNSDEV
jgi:hypothetical protein